MVKKKGIDTVLIDADIILYSAGFAAQRAFYTHVPTGDVYETKGAYRAEHIAEENIQTTVEPEPINYAIHNITSMINKCMLGTETKKFRLFLSDKPTFRDKVATILPYKGNRDPTHKPFHYNEMRQYCIERLAAEIGDNLEADDMLGINQTETTCIASLDKDLDMIPGAHYHWKKKIMYTVSVPDANTWYYTQLLTGDPTDNIYGMRGIGQKRAAVYLQKKPNKMTYYTHILNRYILEVKKNDVLYEPEALKTLEDVDDHAQYWFDENSVLLWILRSTSSNYLDLKNEK